MHETLVGAGMMHPVGACSLKEETMSILGDFTQGLSNIDSRVETKLEEGAQDCVLFSPSALMLPQSYQLQHKMEKILQTQVFQ
jgi:hypothetical protein